MKSLLAAASVFLLSAISVQAQEVPKFQVQIILPVQNEPVDFRQLDEQMKKYKEKPFTLKLNEHFVIGRIDFPSRSDLVVNSRSRGSGFGLLFTSRF